MRITRKSKVITGGVVIAGLAIGLTACNNNPGGQNKENSDSRAAERTFINNQPPPHFNWSQWRQDLISVETAEAQDTPTTTFVTHQGNQDPIFSGPSIGYPIPVTTSLTNPFQLANPGDSTSTALGNIDPNGVYMPPAGEGTFVVNIYKDGSPFINYFEDNTDTIGGPATWNTTTHSIELAGQPTVGVVTGKK